jgi:hypothetical protein
MQHLLILRLMVWRRVLVSSITAMPIFIVIPPMEAAIIPITSQTPSRNNIININSLQHRQTETETPETSSCIDFNETQGN